MKKSNNQDVKKQAPSKPPKRVVKAELDEVISEVGEAVVKPKKRTSGVVALRHKRVMDNIGKKVLKNGKSTRTSKYDALIAEGYSESYARSGGLNNKKTWEKLLEERLSDDKLSNIHAQLMVAKKLDYMLFVHDIKDEDIYDLMQSVNCVPKKIIHGIQGTHVWFWSPDHKSRKDALDMAFKLKGKYAAEKLEVGGAFSKLSDADLADLINTQKKRFLKKD